MVIDTYNMLRCDKYNMDDVKYATSVLGYISDKKSNIDMSFACNEYCILLQEHDRKNTRCRYEHGSCSYGDIWGVYQ